MQAGEPNPVEDGHSEALTIDDYLIERPSQTVLIRVKGDSMIDEQIRDGDWVVSGFEPTQRSLEQRGATGACAGRFLLARPESGPGDVFRGRSPPHPAPAR